jgi:nucleolar GTP-binding protein
MQMGKNYAARCARCGARKEALAAVDEGFAALEALFLKGAAAVDELVDVARALRRLPLVDPFLPTVSVCLSLPFALHLPTGPHCCN